MKVYYIIPVLIFCVGIISFLSFKGPPDEVSKYNGPLYLSSYIKQGRIEEGRLAARVGYPFDIFTEPSYSGYFTVNETTNGNLFFWFFVAENDPASAPLILWLNGGPGCSSLNMLFGGGGPFTVDKYSETLISNPNSWHQNHNILFVDQPIHTGFSFANSSYYVKYSDEAAIHMYDILSQFFQLFPEYKETPFFIVGESYAGKYIPAIAIYIHRKNQETSSTRINLKGIAIGNGLVDPALQIDVPELAFEAGLIDVTTFNSLQKLEEVAEMHLQSPTDATDSTNLTDLVKGCRFKKMFAYLETYNDYCEKVDNSDKSACEFVKVGLEMMNMTITNIRGYMERDCIYLKVMDLIKSINVYNFLEENKDHTMPFSYFVDKPQNKYVLHALNKLFPINANEYPCEMLVNIHMLKDKPLSFVRYVEELLENYKVLLYAGQFDLIVGYPTTVNLIYNLSWSGAEEYRSAERKFWKVDMKTAGYMKTVKNFTELLVRNAGHMVVHDQPYKAHTLITSFTRDLLF